MGTTTINPGDSIQTDGHDLAAAGDTVSMTPGNYFNQTVNCTKNNMIFQSSTGTQSDVKIYGGPQITGFAASGSYWKAASGTTYGVENNEPWNNIGVYGTRGSYKLMCSVDLAYYHHVNSTSNLGDTPPTGASGNFFYDYGTKELWLSNDPGAGIVVLSEQDTAFGGAATGVTIQNVTVSTYEPGIQNGAVGGGTGTSHGSGWTIDNVRVTNVHGVGIQIKGNSSVVQNSTINYIGQLGAGCSPIPATALGPNLYDFTFHNNYVEYCNMKAYQPGHEAGATKFAWVDKLVVTHNEVRYNKGFALWADINVYDTDYRYNWVHHNMMEGLKHEISFCARIRDNLFEHNGTGVWPGVVGEWPEGLQDSGNGAAPGIAIDESNGNWARPGGYANPIVAPYGIIVENNVVRDNRGGIYARTRSDRTGDGSFPGGDAYFQRGLTVQNNDVHWDATLNPNSGHGLGGGPGDPCGQSGVDRNTFEDTDYTLNGTRSTPSGGAWDYCVALGYTSWTTAPYSWDTTSAGAALPAEDYGVISASADTINLTLLEVSPTLYAFDGVIEGAGNIALSLLELGPVVYAPAVTRLSTDTIRINAGGALLAGAPDWEADDTGHAYNDDTVGTDVISNWTGAIDVTSDPDIAALAPPQALFHTERYDNGVTSMSYTIPGLDPVSRYVVRIFASENFSGITGSGQRLFDVFLNAVEVKSDWDLYAESLAISGGGGGGAFGSGFSTAFDGGGSGSGQHVALLFETEVFPTAGGDIVITTANTLQSALFNGIEVQSFDKSATLTLIAAGPQVFAPAVQLSNPQQVFLSLLTVPASVGGLDNVGGSAEQNIFLSLLSVPASLGGIDEVPTPGSSLNVTLPLLALSPTAIEMVVVTNKPIYLSVLAVSPQVFAPTIELDDEGVTVSSELIGPFWFDVIDVDDTTGTTPSSSQVSRTSTFLIGENDTLPSLTGYVRNGRNAILDMSATGINPSGITFSMKNATDGSATVDEQACSYDTVTHIVTYAWQAADTSTAGEFDGEVEVTVPTGKFTAPGKSPKIRITVGGEVS